MKIVTVVGARPQFIKAAAVSRILKETEGVEQVLLHTGQHFDANMSAVFFNELELPLPDYNLGVNGLLHGAMTGRMMEKAEEVLLSERPDWVMVYGDTNSTLAGALAAKKLHLKIAHVEAGMRSGNMRSPEEVNRILTDRISDLLFCSTETAVENLRKEQFDRFKCEIVRTGDVMYDAALYYSRKPKEISYVADTIPFKEFVLCTLHREENTNDPQRLEHILSALSYIHEEIPVVIPLHPRTRAKLPNSGNLPVFILNPVSYLDMIGLLQKCEMVITDSGGLQKEAFFFKKFCITLREETEWVELVDLGVNKITGSSEKKIRDAFHEFKGKKMKVKDQPYGKGHASEKIVETLLKY